MPDTGCSLKSLIQVKLVAKSVLIIPVSVNLCFDFFQVVRQLDSLLFDFFDFVRQNLCLLQDYFPSSLVDHNRCGDCDQRHHNQSGRDADIPPRHPLFIHMWRLACHSSQSGVVSIVSICDELPEL